jgi:outer membrane protein TolC
VELSKKILSKTRIKFSEGVGSSFELATAQQELVSNQMKYVQNVLNVLTNKAELEKVNGKNPLR